MTERFEAFTPGVDGCLVHKTSHLPLTRCVMIQRNRPGSDELLPWVPLSWHTTPALAERAAAKWPQYRTRVVNAWEMTAAPVPEARQ